MIQPWFMDAKLGIFIHYGIYSVNGFPVSWSMFNEEVSFEDYMGELRGFTAANYDPRAWAKLFKRAGARYAVMCTKQHDGVALWDTKLSDLSVVRQSPAGRDLIRPYCEALRAEGLKVGLYFSHLDWNHPDYAPVPLGHRNRRELSNETYPLDWGDSPEWRRYLKFSWGQLEELLTRYGKIDLLWSDGDWTPKSDAFWRMPELVELLRKWQPQIVLNNRLRGLGDYLTPEQGMPVTPPEGPWELCMSINDNWSYVVNDHNHKSVRQIVRIFAEVIGMGGNLLLDVGPKEDGTILPEQVERLEGLGHWIARHAEAVYGTTAGMPHGHLYGASTLSKDRETLYALIFDRPWDEISIKGIRNPIKRISVLGDGRELSYRKIGGGPSKTIPGVLWVQVPDGTPLDPYATVLKIELEGPLDLFHGAG